MLVAIPQHLLVQIPDVGRNNELSEIGVDVLIFAHLAFERCRVRLLPRLVAVEVVESELVTYDGVPVAAVVHVAEVVAFPERHPV